MSFNEFAVKEITRKIIACNLIAVSYGDLTYITYDTYAEVIDYKDSVISVEIPETIDGKPVTSIGDYAFAGCDTLESITIPDSVTSIGDEAFDGCDSLKSITIPDSVTSIGDYAFVGCSSLQSITIPDSVTIIGMCAFKECSSLQSVTIGNSVTSIGLFAFEDCSNISSITISDSVTSFDGSAFSDTAYYNNESNWENGVLYIGNHLIRAKEDISGDYEIKNGTKTIAGSAFYNCSSLQSITIPDSVTSIGDGAFAGCSSLQSITIPDSVTSIGYGAFWNCDSLQSIIIPDSVTSIGDSAFGFCRSLQSITIPDSVTSIDYFAFSYCTSLESISVSGNNIHYSSIDGVLFNKNKTSLICYPAGKTATEYEIPGSVTSIGDGAFGGCSSLQSITIPDSVTSIGSDAFAGCSSLQSITIPDSVTSIGNQTFYGCSNLSSITIPSSVTSIGYGAFIDCISLQSITIPDSVTSIGNYAFANTAYYNNESNWENSVLYIGNHLIDAKGDISGDYEIKNGTKTIADEVFYNGNSLQSITIPDSVTSIGDYAFSDCSSLQSITIPDSVKSIGRAAFSGCGSLQSITIPDSVTSIGSYAFNYTAYYYNESNWENGVLYIGNHLIEAKESISGDYEIKNGTKTIAGGAFDDCSTLENITIPDSVISIGEEAFVGCSILESVTIPKSVTSIGEGAFSVSNLYYGNECRFCLLSSIIVDEDNDNYSSKDGVLFNKDKTVLISYPAGKSAAEYIIPETVTSIDHFAFESSKVKSVSIPKTVTYINENSFFRCYNLSTVYYTGSEEQWNNIFFDRFMEMENASHYKSLANATIIFNNGTTVC